MKREREERDGERVTGGGGYLQGFGNEISGMAHGVGVISPIGKDRIGEDRREGRTRDREVE
jgi:hypothetical protein